MDFRKDIVRIKNIKYTITGFSIIGDGKKENQDSFDYFYDDNQIIIALADGLGSAIFSKEGSLKIVKQLIDVLRENIEYSKVPLELFNRWKKSIDGNLNLHDTTIKFIQIKDGKIRYGGIGDGWIAINLKDKIISHTSSNIFSNQTDSILSFDLTNKFLINEIDEQKVLNIIISTDGFSEDIEMDNSKSFMDDVLNEITHAPVKFEEEMKSTLANWPIESNKDDKTVIFIKKEEV